MSEMSMDDFNDEVEGYMRPWTEELWGEFGASWVEDDSLYASDEEPVLQ